MHISSISTSSGSMTRSPAMTACAFVGVALQQGVHRRAEGGLRLARHGQEADLDLAQLVVKMAMGLGHPNLPVMYASVRPGPGR